MIMARSNQKVVASCPNGHNVTEKGKLNGSLQPVESNPVDLRTDINRWRLRDERGMQTWHYLESDEEIKEWPQSIVDRHHLGLPLVCQLHSN